VNYAVFASNSLFWTTSESSPLMHRAALMEIIEDRHGKTSLIITSQLPVSKWHEVIGEKTIADAILDRIVHDAHRLELTGESMRKKRKPEPETQEI